MKRCAPSIFAAFCLILSACASAPPPTPTLATAPHLGVAEMEKAAPGALACPACKVIIDYSALQAAGADLDKHAYGAWVAVRAGLESGRFTWDEVKGIVYEACDKADEVRAYIAKAEKEIRALAERKAPSNERVELPAAALAGLATVGRKVK